METTSHIRKGKFSVPTEPKPFYAIIKEEINGELVTDKGIFSKKNLLKEWKLSKRDFKKNGGKLEVANEFKKITTLWISRDFPLSTKLEKLTGDKWSTRDFESVDGGELTSFEPFRHKKTGKIFVAKKIPTKPMREFWNKGGSMAEGGDIKTKYYIPHLGKSEKDRIDSMVKGWKEDGIAYSYVTNDDSEFFERIGIPYGKLGITSQVGNDIVYYDTNIYSSDRNALRNIKIAKGGSMATGGGIGNKIWVVNILSTEGGKPKHIKKEIELGHASDKTDVINAIIRQGIEGEILSIEEKMAKGGGEISGFQFPMDEWKKLSYNEQLTISNAIQLGIGGEKFGDILSDMREKGKDYLNKKELEKYRNNSGQKNPLSSGGSMAKGGKLEVANEIKRQLGHGTLFMLGAKDIASDEKSLSFKIRGSKKWRHIEITLNAKDLYDITFTNWHKLDFSDIEKKTINDVYADQMHEVIENETGLYTKLAGGGKIRIHDDVIFIKDIETEIFESPQQEKGIVEKIKKGEQAIVFDDPGEDKDIVGVQFGDGSVTWVNKDILRKEMATGGKINQSMKNKRTQHKEKLQEEIKIYDGGINSPHTQEKYKEKMKKAKSELEKKLLQYAPVKEKMEKYRKFYMEIDGAYKTRLYHKLRNEKIKAEFASLNKTRARVFMYNRSNLGKVYEIYSDMLTENGQSVPELSAISGKVPK